MKVGDFSTQFPGTGENRLLVHRRIAAILQYPPAVDPDITDVACGGAVGHLADRVIDRLGRGCGQVDGDEISLLARPPFEQTIPALVWPFPLRKRLPHE